MAAMSGVEWLDIDTNYAGQRVDNFLLTRLKGVPKSRVYRLLRKGEVRVNKKRVKPEYRLQEGDVLRLPPVRTSACRNEHEVPDAVSKTLGEPLMEDDALLVINKPSGLAVHGGSGLKWGVIEVLRATRPEVGFLELAHRLDRETSGVLILAKSRAALLGVQQQLTRKAESRVEKSYLAVLSGKPLRVPETVTVALRIGRNNEGKKISIGAEKGEVAAHPAKSVFLPVQQGEGWQLVRIQLMTGRMHQARAHAREVSRPILGDTLYGDWAANKAAQKKWGVNRLMLHSERYAFDHPVSGKRLTVSAPMPGPMQVTLETMRLEA